MLQRSDHNVKQLLVMYISMKELVHNVKNMRSESTTKLKIRFNFEISFYLTIFWD